MKIRLAFLASIATVWPAMTLAAFASRMAVSRSLKAALPDLYSASFIPISVGEDEAVSEGATATTLQQVAIKETSNSNVSLAFVVRRPG